MIIHLYSCLNFNNNIKIHKNNYLLVIINIILPHKIMIKFLKRVIKKLDMNSHKTLYKNKSI